MKKIKYLSMILFLSLVSCKNPVTVNNLVTLHLGEGKINNLNTLVLTYDEFMNLDKYFTLQEYPPINFVHLIHKLFCNFAVWFVDCTLLIKSRICLRPSTRLCCRSKYRS